MTVFYVRQMPTSYPLAFFCYYLLHHFSSFLFFMLCWQPRACRDLCCNVDHLALITPINCWICCLVEFASTSMLNMCDCCRWVWDGDWVCGVEVVNLCWCFCWRMLSQQVKYDLLLYTIKESYFYCFCRKGNSWIKWKSTNVGSLNSTPASVNSSSPQKL